MPDSLLERGANPRRVDATGADASPHASRMGARSAAVLAAARRAPALDRPSATA